MKLYIIINIVDVGFGESCDVIFIVFDLGIYLLYDCWYFYFGNGGGLGYGGMMMCIVVNLLGMLLL